MGIREAMTLKVAVGHLFCRSCLCMLSPLLGR